MINFFDQNKQYFSLENFIQNAIKEDVRNGDFTTLSTIPEFQHNTMKLLVKQEGIIAGVEAIQRIINHLNENINMHILIPDGTFVKKGETVFYLAGNTQKLLSFERLILNIMQRMSGIATKTNYLQSLCNNTNTKITDTRKTTPLFRFFEKWAVHIGGGVNHRWGLFDMILIKDNHIDAAGGIEKAVNMCRNYMKKNNLNLKIEVETRNLREVELALKTKPDRIMLDNFCVKDVETAVQRIKSEFPHIETEASGGINEKNIADYAQTGVDFISIGALTHHINSLDLSLKIID